MRRAALVLLILVRLLTQSAEAATVTLAWDPNGEPDLGGYFLSYGTVSGQYTTTIDVGNVTSYLFTEPNPSVRYYLALRAYNTSGAISPYSNEVFTNPNPSLTVTGLTSNKMSPQPAGTSILFSAVATGGTTPYQFKWWIDNGGTSTMGQQWSTSNTFTWTPTAPSASYSIRVWARNAGSTADAPANPGATLSMTFNITAAVSNQAPTVNAGPNKTVTLPATVTLSGTASDDGKPTPPATLTLSWIKVSGPGTVTFTPPNAASTTAAFSTSGTYVLRLTASDSALSASDDVTVTVNPAAAGNLAPVVNAGADKTITLPATATLSGTVSDDGKPAPPGIVTSSWTRVSGPGTVTFSAPSAAATTAAFSASGTYVLRLTASDTALSASDDVTVVVNPASGGGTGTGLTGAYYNDQSAGGRFTTLAMTRTDPTVNFNWVYSAPAAGVQTDYFSVRWTGQIQVPVTGTYRFATTSDDGVRLWVNGQRIIDNWTDHGATVNTSGAVTLTAGVKYSIRLDFYERGGRAQIQLRWTPPGQAESVIPATQLFP